MKILCAEYGPDGEISIVPVGDNALLRNNDDFYFPDFTTALSCCPQGGGTYQPFREMYCGALCRALL